MDIRPFTRQDEAAIIDLWTQCGLTRPWNDPHKDIERKLRVQPELFLVGVIDGRVVATVMAGYDGHRGSLNYLAVAPEHQRKGLGRRIVEEPLRRLAQLGCPKVNLLVRGSNAGVLGFYRKLGFAPDDVVALGKRLISDDPPAP